MRERFRDRRFQQEATALGLVMLAAFILRVAWLDTIPGNITADEADNLQTIFRMQVTGDPGPFGLDWKPQPAMSMYLFAGFMAVFGEDIFGLRMASAVLSTLALLPFYALARRVVRPVSALGGAALLATGLWYLNFSRSGWENVHVAFYALLAAWALTVALERKQLRWFAVAGVAAALGLYGYFAGRLILIALLAYAPLAVWWARDYRRQVVLGYALLTVTAVVLFLPQLPAITEDRETFNRRTDAVNVFDQPGPYMGKESNIDILRLQIDRNARGFFLFDGSMFTNGRYGPEGETLLDPVTGILLISGMVIGLSKWRQTGLWWALLLIPLAATQIPTTMSPNGARALIVAPFMYLFVTLTLDALIDLVRARRRELAAIGVIVGVMILSALNVSHYFEWIQSPEAIQAREPAVELADYELWRDMLKEGFADDGPGFHLGDWSRMVEDLREQERTNQ
jgi:4-amino-4-deoxy-L-arabinose transferase-like glycosyltransferase